MESSTNIALGVLGTAILGLLGYNYMQRSTISDLKDYRKEACNHLYSQNHLFNREQVDKLLNDPTSTLDNKDLKMLEDCKNVIFPSRWFGGKKTRRQQVRKETFTPRRR